MFFLFYLSIFTASSVDHNPLTEPSFPVIQNQGFTKELYKSYVRLPDRAKDKVREPVWQNSRYSSGLAIYFKTNSKDIVIKYSVTNAFSMPHMASTGVSGVDLLAKDTDGEWYSVLSSFSFSGSTVTYNFNNIRAGEHDFRLYLPLYNSIKNDLVITVNDGASFTWIEKDYSPAIVSYGTSIMHGASASRPILTWASILQRRLDRPLINLGFSANGKLEPEVLDFVVENDACLYILDCLPNLGGYSADSIKSLFINAVKQIRKTRPTVPILAVDHAGYSYLDMSQAKVDELKKINTAQREGFDQLVSEGVKGLYYMTREEIGLDLDSWTDYVHPNNYGAIKYADAYEKKILEILG